MMRWAIGVCAIAVLVVVLVSVAIHTADRVGCASRWHPRATVDTVLGGCTVELSPGNWLPERNVFVPTPTSPKEAR